MDHGDWAKIRVFNHLQFSDPKVLLQKKREKNHTISLCLPTLNEALTIKKIIKSISAKLRKQHPIIDEIFIIDSGSTDGTQRIAKQMGIPVYQSQDILRESGDIRGKGENLWKSIYIANGDIIMWLDSDIRNIHPRFVTGLLGPLLFQPEISFVKGYYRRPIKIGKKLCPSGGGRVTEILMKPYLNLLFPQLALFFQPLSGEYAGRRELLERLPFYTGYGVETGLLIDIENRFGLSCMAQVDLDVRIHRNQDLIALKKMAFGILRVLLNRAEQQGKLILLNNMEQRLFSLIKDEFGQFELHYTSLNEIERPPMILNKSYQKKRELSEEDLVLLDEIQEKRSYPFISISPLLDTQLMELNGDAQTKDETLEHISRLMTKFEYTRNFPQLYHEFCKRENTMSTGIGSGVAIPHVISSTIKRMKIAVYRSRNGIMFDSLDGRPVFLVFAVAAPITRRGHYLQTLASLSMILKDYKNRSCLMKIENSQDFINKFRKIEVVNRFERELRAVES